MPKLICPNCSHEITYLYILKSQLHIFRGLECDQCHAKLCLKGNSYKLISFFFIIAILYSQNVWIDIFIFLLIVLTYPYIVIRMGVYVKPKEKELVLEPMVENETIQYETLLKIKDYLVVLLGPIFLMMAVVSVFSYKLFDVVDEASAAFWIVVINVLAFYINQMALVFIFKPQWIYKILNQFKFYVGYVIAWASFSICILSMFNILILQFIEPIAQPLFICTITIGVVTSLAQKVFNQKFKSLSVQSSK